MTQGRSGATASGVNVTPWAAHPLGSLRQFIRTENSSAIILLLATVTALVWANSPWAESYEQVWHTEFGVSFGGWDLTLDLRHWINDGLMAIFFFVVGLEIRREFDMGELRERRRLATPVIAALGGMLLPAFIYLAFNLGEASARGWGIVMGTDTAFALGVLSLAGAASPRVRTFLLTLVIVDDVVALTVIAIVYTENLSLSALMVAVVLFGVVAYLRSKEWRNGAAFFVLSVGVWLATFYSGVHATVAGVALGVLATAYPPKRQDLAEARDVFRRFREAPTPKYAHSASRTLARAVSPNERLQHLIHPWTSFFIVPLFALANAGVAIDGEAVSRALRSPISLGIIFGLVVGKLVGITAFTWVAARYGKLPLTVSWPALVGAATVAGVGFTVSLLIAGISFTGDDLEEAKIGILAASIIAALLSYIAFKVIERLPSRLRSAGYGRLAPPIEDLSEPVIDPEVDHVRGTLDASIVLVEYGDFECPYCFRARDVLDDLAGTFGSDIAFVFRHLPLIDVHEQAMDAAVAAEAAAEQGMFWEMHDLLFANQDALERDDLIRHAGSLGLDVARFERDLDDRGLLLRVEHDMETADESGAAGTPTFFINGRRHTGRPDLASLTAAIARELAADPVRSR